MTTITELSTTTLAEMMGDVADERDGRIMMSLLSRDCVTDTDDISEERWMQYLEEAAAIRQCECDDD